MFLMLKVDINLVIEDRKNQQMKDLTVRKTNFENHSFN